jgi:DNA-binding NtrC family response regulator/CHASE2 domain-containing sensor protein
MKSSHRISVMTATVAVIGIVLFTFIVRPVDEQLIGTRYVLRGKVPADTNIVLVYLDNEDIQLLGGWPLQRSYYALMMDRLDRWGARVIGLDILLESTSAVSSEYDRLLADVANRIPSLLTVCYGRTKTADTTQTEIPESFLYRLPDALFDEQYEIVVPYTDLLRRVDAIGHSNIDGSFGQFVPAFLNTGEGAVAAFGIEAAREYLRIDREAGVVVKGNKLSLRRPDSKYLKYPLDRLLRLHVNHLGSVDQFTSVRFPQLLKEGPGAEHLRRLLEDKIVLIGVIAEGRSTFISSPYTSHIPSLVHHATVIDNALQERFIRYPSLPTELVIPLLLAFAGLIVARYLAGVKGLLSVAALAVIYTAVAIYCFAHFSYVLPVIAPVTGLFAGALISFVLYIRSFERKLDSLEREKSEILGRLTSREDRLQELQLELERARRQNDTAGEEKLAAQVLNYEAEIRELRAQVDDTEADASVDPDTVMNYEGLLHSGRGSVRPVIAMIGKVSGTDAPVLLLGESGTGKELAAKAIHARSGRKDRPFIAVNCGALSETLLESELFGHERGAFTGAVSAKPGRFELADGGTIFLDEIAETSEAFQVKLLRVLQEGTYERVGGTETKTVDVRVIAATNRDIDQALAEKKFRRDLYYRLNVFPITMPPLRERREDIALLIAEFLKQHSADLKISRLALGALRDYSWPGNVRELQAVIQRAALLALSEQRAIIRLHDLPKSVLDEMKPDIDIEEQILEELRLRKFSRNAISGTARELGNLNRGTVAEYLRGFALRAFVENSYDRELTAQMIAGSDDPEMIENTGKKLHKYLKNISGSVDRSKSLGELDGDLRGKYKNLPQRYHPALKSVIEAYYHGKWDMKS